MTQIEMTDQEYVEAIVKPLSSRPDEVVTTRTVDEMGVLIQLTVSRDDMGKVIGRDGRTAKAIRSLLKVFGAQKNARINLKIVEPEGGREVAIPEDKNAKPAEQATSVV